MHYYSAVICLCLSLSACATKEYVPQAGAPTALLYIRPQGVHVEVQLARQADCYVEKFFVADTSSKRSQSKEIQRIPEKIQSSAVRPDTYFPVTIPAKERISLFVDATIGTQAAYRSCRYRINFTPQAGYIYLIATSSACYPEFDAFKKFDPDVYEAIYPEGVTYGGVACRMRQ